MGVHLWHKAFHQLGIMYSACTSSIDKTPTMCGHTMLVSDLSFDLQNSKQGSVFIDLCDVFLFYKPYKISRAFYEIQYTIYC